MKKILFVLMTGWIMVQSNAYAQITPSVYAGWGLGTNIGGELGIGTEVKYKMISLNAALGSWIGEFPTHTGASSRLDYDFGAKVYPGFGTFLGVNYGIIGEAMYTKTVQTLLHFEKTHGFSFTVGYRHTIYKNLYASGFIGLTSNKKENYIVIFDDKSFIPRLGVLLGWEFKTSK